MASWATPAESTIATLPPATRPLRRLYLLALALVVAGAAALLVDLPLARFFHDFQQSGPGDLRKGIALFEIFGHGIGAAIIITAVAVLDRARYRQALRLIVCTYGAGLVNLGLKLTIGRSRPQTYWDTELPQRASDTFVGLAPLLSGPWSAALEREMQSFPSGHSATAAGLAVGLAWLYPQGRYFFAMLAALAMLQRVQSGAHFPSDTLMGAAVGVLVAAMCCDRRFGGRWLDRLTVEADCRRPAAAID